jgi:4a-hydroxytetrahydrobiopterin dehydratase
MDYRSFLGGGLLMGVLSWSGLGTLADASPLLRAADGAEQMQTLPHWITDGQHLTCTFEFANFVESVAFVNSLVEPAEALGHHPDLHISYNRVTVSLSTHDVGGLTLLDFAVARAIAQPCPEPMP